MELGLVTSNAGKLRELAAALAPFGTVAGEAPARAALVALMRRFPDRDSSN